MYILMHVTIVNKNQMNLKVIELNDIVNIKLLLKFDIVLGESNTNSHRNVPTHSVSTFCSKCFRHIQHKLTQF